MILENLSYMSFITNKSFIFINLSINFFPLNIILNYSIWLIWWQVVQLLFYCFIFLIFLTRSEILTTIIIKINVFANKWKLLRLKSIWLLILLFYHFISIWFLFRLIHAIWVELLLLEFWNCLLMNKLFMLHLFVQRFEVFRVISLFILISLILFRYLTFKLLSFLLDVFFKWRVTVNDFA